MVWCEYLDFFFVKDRQTIYLRSEAKPEDEDNDWWLLIDIDGQFAKNEETPTKKKDIKEEELTSSQKKEKEQLLRDQKREIEITPSLQLLIDSRRVRTENEVEEEYKKKQKLLKFTKQMEAENGK